MRCSACGEDCRIVEVDYGVGRFEYWGATGWDSQIARVSNCCETETIDDDWACEPDEYISEYDMEMSEA